MILRKPYALLIKNFKLIHIILSLMMIYLFYKTNAILSFLGEYIGSSQIKISSDVLYSLFDPIFIVLVAVAFLFLYVVE